MTARAETYLPTFRELKVPVELNVTTPFLRAASLHMHQYCEPQCHEFMLCRNEERDPRKCINEGKDVTACGVEFLQKVKKNCRKEYDEYAECLEYRAGGRYSLARCRKPQRAWDLCAWEKLGVERPPNGAVSKVHLHEPISGRPMPKEEKDYAAEAAKVLTELPHTALENRDTYANVKPASFDWFSDV